MATIVLNELSFQPHCLAFYRNPLKKVPKQKWTVMNGYVDDGFNMVEEQREGYMRELHDCMLLHFKEKPEDPWQIKHIWDHHTTPEEVYKFFGYDIHNLNGPIYIENVDPWLCFTEDNDLVLYFGEDKPVLKTKISKIFTKHAKIWANHIIFRENKENYEYKYWDVKDKSKLLFCGHSTVERVFPEFDWFNIDPYGKDIKRSIDLGVFRASDPYDYSDEEKAEILRKKAEDEERKRKYQEDLEELKHTPGHCCRCGSANAEYVIHPYDLDMYGNENYVWLCSDCYSDLAGDI